MFCGLIYVVDILIHFWQHRYWWHPIIYIQMIDALTLHAHTLSLPQCVLWMCERKGNFWHISVNSDEICSTLAFAYNLKFTQVALIIRARKSEKTTCVLDTSMITVSFESFRSEIFTEQQKYHKCKQKPYSSDGKVVFWIYGIYGDFLLSNTAKNEPQITNSGGNKGNDCRKSLNIKNRFCY